MLRLLFNLDLHPNKPELACMGDTRFAPSRLPAPQLTLAVAVAALICLALALLRPEATGWVPGGPLHFAFQRDLRVVAGPRAF